MGEEQPKQETTKDKAWKNFKSVIALVGGFALFILILYLVQGGILGVFEAGKSIFTGEPVNIGGTTISEEDHSNLEQKVEELESQVKCLKGVANSSGGDNLDPEEYYQVNDYGDSWDWWFDPGRLMDDTTDAVLSDVQENIRNCD